MNLSGSHNPQDPLPIPVPKIPSPPSPSITSIPDSSTAADGLYSLKRFGEHFRRFKTASEVDPCAKALGQRARSQASAPLSQELLSIVTHPPMLRLPSLYVAELVSAL